MASSPPTPLYSRIADALTAFLLVAIVGGSILGLTRYNDARDHRRVVQARVAGVVDSIAAAVARGGVSAAESGFDQLAAIHVVTSGGTDEFGIAVGSEVALTRVMDATAQPADPSVFAQELLNISAELEDYQEKGQPIPESRRFGAAELRGEHDGQALFAAHAPIVVEGVYQGLVRATERVITPPSSVPTSRFLLVLLLALLFGAAASWSHRRVGLAVATAGAVVILFWGQATGLILWPALVGLGCGLAFSPGMAAVFRGVREQPRTYLYIVPAMLGMIVLVFVPFAMGVAISFFSDGDFTGFENFEEILFPSDETHPTFYWTTGVTIVWTVLNVVLHVSIGVALALVLNRPNLRGKAIYRVLLIVPWAVPNYITALIWKSMFNPQFGAVNGLLDVFGIEAVNWLGPGSSFTSNFVANLVTNTWLGFPFMMVVTLGALQSIPQDLYEAADIDGAGRWQRFTKVTVPLLKPALVPAIILGVIWTFNMFNVIYLVSGGAPENETNILITEAYHAFKVLNRFGLAAAYSLLIFLMLLAYGWMQNRITRATEGAFE